MFFGDEHLGRAVALLRESADLNQKELAQKIGVEPNTMNQYESGRRGMSEDVIFKAAAVLQRDPSEIWDMAYAIFRFNHFRERAEREGLDVEDLIARAGTRPTVESILGLLDALAPPVRQLFAAILRLLDPAGGAGLGGLGMVKVVVQLHRHKSAKTRRAVRFSRAKRPSPPEAP